MKVGSLAGVAAAGTPVTLVGLKITKALIFIKATGKDAPSTPRKANRASEVADCFTVFRRLDASVFINAGGIDEVKDIVLKTYALAEVMMNEALLEI
jgi:hypothetical protein